MQIDVQRDVYDKFQRIKSKYFSELSDSEFLSSLLDHVDSPNLRDGRSFLDESFSGKQLKAEGLDEHRKCPECKFSTSSTGSLHEHFESAHNENGSFSCTCGDSYSRLPDFLQHYIDCPVAATDLQDPPKNPRKRVKRSPDSKDEDTTASDANGSIEDATETYYSYRHPSVSPIAGPSDDKPFGCPKCLKGFKSKSLLDQHMHLHYPPRYKCRWCGNVYRWPPVYYHHKQKCKKRPLHHSGSFTPASECSGLGGSYRHPDPALSVEHFTRAQTTFAQFMHLHSLRLLQQTGSSNGQPLSNPAAADAPNVIPLTCICSEAFPNLPSYLEHAKSCSSMLSASTVFEHLAPHPLFHPPSLGLDLSTSAIPDSPDQDRSVAADLSSSKDTTANYSSHSNGIFPCSICGKDFNSKLSLKQHVDGKHRAEGKYLCPTCGKRYRWGASFYYHKKTCVVSEVPSVVNNQTPELLASHT
ncbi:unnamed protein product [Dicrocoelium dendriticum]|nr:unnamed protein product [Dicrocoelium dendriticum]